MSNRLTKEIKKLIHSLDNTDLHQFADYSRECSNFRTKRFIKGVVVPTEEYYRKVLTITQKIIEFKNNSCRFFFAKSKEEICKGLFVIESLQAFK